MKNLNELLQMVIPKGWLFSTLPMGISDHASEVDTLYWFLIITCLILFLLVVIPLIIISIKYRRKTPLQRAISQIDHNFWMESLWTFLPFIYLTILFVWGFQQFLPIYIAPTGAKELRVVGQKWQWSVDYVDEEINVAGVGATIAVPVGQPIKLVMSSQDVIHSFYIPNLRLKQDVVPGKYTTMSFRADREGEYPILCAEYCGDLHSQMLAKLKVLPAEGYASWVNEMKSADQEMPLLELGTKLSEKLGCLACHSTDGTAKLAPSFKGIYGKKEEFSGGGSAIINDDYIRQHILEPQKTTAKGYPPIMPSFQGRVTERGISALIAFIKSLAE